jgi:hypothetical protein
MSCVGGLPIGSCRLRWNGDNAVVATDGGQNTPAGAMIPVS